ncbi:MAG: tetratricopeptide repeat protein [Candidatus Omnitrophica bacterium]|jgi:tetratricopeptide (TPR) repeat protein|nr:tetratricopeptide repeat protein [Candidatus Omnitrophota bacterium]
MVKKIASKASLTLMLSFLLAVAFLFIYNRYLLDKSLSNLRISLKVIEKAGNFEEVKKIKDILKDTFIMEISAGNFDLARAEKEDVSGGPKARGLTAQDENKIFTDKLSIATKLDYIEDIVEGISEQKQIEDIKYFIEDIIAQKIKEKPLFVANLEKFIVEFFPQPRQEKFDNLKNQVESLKQQLANYSGRQLQEKILEIARMYLRMGEWDESQTYLNKTLLLGSQNYSGLKAQFYLAVLYKLKGNYQDSLLVFQKIKDILPLEWKMFSYYQEADSLAALGDKVKAVNVLEQAFDKNPDSEISQVAKFRAAYTYLYDLNDPEKARQAFKELKDKITVEEDKGKTTDQKELEKLKISFYAAEKIIKDICNKYREEGYQLLKQGYTKFDSIKYLEALDKFNLALKDDNQDPLAISGKSLALYFIGKREEAIQESRRAKEISPNDAIVLVNLGFIYYNVGMLEEAVGEYRAALKIKPNSALINYNLGTLYILSGDLNRAGFHLERSIEINPDFAYPLNNLGYLSWLQGGYGEAKRWLEKAIAFKDDYVDGRYNLAIVLFILGKYDAAQEEFLKVEELSPGYKKTGWYLSEIKKK